MSDPTEDEGTGTDEGTPETPTPDAPPPPQQMPETPEPQHAA